MGKYKHFEKFDLKLIYIIFKNEATNNFDY